MAVLAFADDAHIVSLFPCDIVVVVVAVIVVVATTTDTSVRVGGETP